PPSPTLFPYTTLFRSYSLGIDGISLFLIVLTTLLWTGATVFSAIRRPDRARLYFLMLGLGETATLGAFCAQDLLLFVLFFDLMLDRKSTRLNSSHDQI